MHWPTAKSSYAEPNQPLSDYIHFTAVSAANIHYLRISITMEFTILSARYSSLGINQNVAILTNVMRSVYGLTTNISIFDNDHCGGGGVKVRRIASIQPTVDGLIISHIFESYYIKMCIRRIAKCNCFKHPIINLSILLGLLKSIYWMNGYSRHLHRDGCR